MRSIRKVQGLIGTGISWSKKGELVDWQPFMITGARSLTTKFGPAYEFTLTHIETFELKIILMAPSLVRIQILEYFDEPNAEPLGPCRLQMGEKAWMFLEVQEDPEQLALENVQF